MFLSTMGKIQSNIVLIMIKYNTQVIFFKKRLLLKKNKLHLNVFIIYRSRDWNDYNPNDYSWLRWFNGFF